MRNHDLEVETRLHLLSRQSAPVRTHALSVTLDDARVRSASQRALAFLRERPDLLAGHEVHLLNGCRSTRCQLEHTERYNLLRFQREHREVVPSSEHNVAFPSRRLATNFLTRVSA